MNPHRLRLLTGKACDRTSKRRGFLPATLRLKTPEEQEGLRICRNLFFTAEGQAPSTVMFSAAESQNGCSTVCADVAVTLAKRTSASVCIVDANSESPSQHIVFDVNNDKGLRTTISSWKSVTAFAERLAPSNVWVVTPGARQLSTDQIPIDPYRIELAVSEIVAAFDYVFINAPFVDPFLHVTSKDQLAWCVRDAALRRLSPNIYRVSLGTGSTRDAEAEVISRLCQTKTSPTYRAVLFSDDLGGVSSAASCARTAMRFAERTGASVCVLDGDFRRPSLHRFVGLQNATGLLQLFVECNRVANFAQRLSIGNLWLIPSGSVVGKFENGVSWERLRAILAELQSEFDYILIDAPPVDSCPETALLAQLVDSVVMVVEANATPPEVARRAKKSLEAAKPRLLAIVLNKRTFPIPELVYNALLRGPLGCSNT